MAYQFKVGDTGKTRDGHPYRVIATDVAGEYPILALVSYEDGEFPMRRRRDGVHLLTGQSPGDLIPSTPAVYINVYDDSDGTLWTPEAIHSARDVADKCASGLRVGCIRVELEARFDD
jgi:hypothetical protein